MQDEITYNNRDLIDPNPIDPGRISSDLQVFPQKGMNPYNYNLQQGESSTSTGEPSTLNNGKRKLSELDDIQSRDEEYKRSKCRLSKYPCINIYMDTVNINNVFIDFNPTTLSTEGASYLYRISDMGSRVLFDHYE